MDEGTLDQISSLLRRGLNHYGLGEVEAAIDCWEKVCELDPENAAARDYLRNAHEEFEPQPPTDDGTRPTETEITDPKTGESPSDLVAKALALYRGGRLEDARARLERAAEQEPDRLDIQGYLELVRGQLLKRYEKEIGDRGRNVRVAVSSEQLKGWKLGPEEGYLLSQIDGSLTIDDLLSLSTVGRFRTLELLARLLRDRIIE